MAEQQTQRGRQIELRLRRRAGSGTLGKIAALLKAPRHFGRCGVAGQHQHVPVCRLEVGRSDLKSLRHDGDGRYTARLEPGMDQTNARQLRGCLEDWTTDHVRIDVVAFRRA